METLIASELDYLCVSPQSEPLIDQPGHGGCLHAGTLEWTWDQGVIKIINNTYSKIGSKKIGAISDA